MSETIIATSVKQGKTGKGNLDNWIYELSDGRKASTLNQEVANSITLNTPTLVTIEQNGPYNNIKEVHGQGNAAPNTASIPEPPKQEIFTKDQIIVAQCLTKCVVDLAKSAIEKGANMTVEDTRKEVLESYKWFLANL